MSGSIKQGGNFLAAVTDIRANAIKPRYQKLGTLCLKQSDTVVAFSQISVTAAQKLPQMFDGTGYLPQPFWTANSGGTFCTYCSKCKKKKVDIYAKYIDGNIALEV